jgi:ActR/RegA family two-component response regulator
MTGQTNNVYSLLFGLSDELTDELRKVLRLVCSNIQRLGRDRTTVESHAVADSRADIIFCTADVNVVSELRKAKPDACIVVVSRYPEVSGWLDAIEAGATDYCAPPFETAQVKWIVETAMYGLKRQ